MTGGLGLTVPVHIVGFIGVPKEQDSPAAMLASSFNRKAFGGRHRHFYVLFASDSCQVFVNRSDHRSKLREIESLDFGREWIEKLVSRDGIGPELVRFLTGYK